MVSYKSTRPNQIVLTPNSMPQRTDRKSHRGYRPAKPSTTSSSSGFRPITGGPLEHEAEEYTVTQVANLLVVSSRSVRRCIAQGDLLAHKFEHQVRISEIDLWAFVERRQAA
jgi:excisionase family DNA binding protein